MKYIDEDAFRDLNLVHDRTFNPPWREKKSSQSQRTNWRGLQSTESPFRSHKLQEFIHFSLLYRSINNTNNPFFDCMSPNPLVYICGFVTNKQTSKNSEVQILQNMLSYLYNKWLSATFLLHSFAVFYDWKQLVFGCRWCCCCCCCWWCSCGCWHCGS